MRGFNLLELVCAMAIVSILSAIAIPSYSSYLQQSRREQVKSKLTEISVQLTQARLANSPSVLPQTASINQVDDDYDLSLNIDSNGVNYLIAAKPKDNQQQDGTGLLTLNSEGLGCWYEGNDDPGEGTLCPENHAW